MNVTFLLLFLTSNTIYHSHNNNSPTSKPTSKPSSRPSSLPSMQPSSQPTAEPSCLPTTQPSNQPSAQPSSKPSQRKADNIVVPKGHAVNGGAVAGIVIGLLAILGISVGAYMHFKNRHHDGASLLKNMSEHGFEDDI